MLWSVLISALLRGFAVAEWAGSAPGRSVLVTLGALTVAGLLLLAAARLYLLASGAWTAAERAVLHRRAAAAA